MRRTVPLRNVPFFLRMVRRHTALHTYAVVTSVATFLLLIAGGLVTSTDSGLAVPDWPLSYGTWFPPMVGGIRYEHGHRLIAAAVGLMIVVLAVWLGRVESRRWVRRVGYSALAAVVVQGLLGGLTVLWLLPPQVSVAHACLGQAVFCLTVCLASCTSPSGTERPSRYNDTGVPSLWMLGVAAAVLAASQLLLGAMLRHTGHGVLWHVSGAIVLAVAVGWFVRRLHVATTAPRACLRMGRRLAWLVALQWLLGFLALWRREHVLIVTAHVGLGALVLAQAVVLAWQACLPAPCPPMTALARQAGRVTRATGSGTMQQLADYLALTKPRVTALVLVTVAAGFWLGMPSAHAALQLLPLLVGTAMAVGGANALNQWSERLPDGLMRRTKGRPIPSGRVNPDDALRFGIALSAGGVLLLAVVVNILAAALTALTIAIYVLAYTPLKRMTSLCTLIGAIPGAMPPVIGWAAARNALSIEAWGLFMLLFLWQLPHFLAIAVLYRDDYARAGFKMLPVVEPSGLATARQTALYGLALLPVSLLPTYLGFAGPWYGYGALVLGLALLVVSVRAAVVRSVSACRQLFRASVVYLPLLLALMVLDKRMLL